MELVALSDSVTAAISSAATRLPSTAAAIKTRRSCPSRDATRGWISEATLRAVEEDAELADTLSVAAHLIHGSSEGRFRIRYAAGGLSGEQIEAVGFEPADVDEALRRYPPEKMRDGWNTMDDGEEVYYISNPALGLWAQRSKFVDAE